VSSDDEQEPKLCTFANKGTCSFADDKCKYRHKRCQNYDSCSQSDCRLAHAPREVTKSFDKSRKPCNSGIQCFKADCKFQHPEGWSACKNGTKCVTYECISNHPPGRKKKCFNEDRCNKDGCEFLHPSKYTTGHAQSTFRLDRNPSKPYSPNVTRKNPTPEDRPESANKQLSKIIKLSHVKYDYLTHFGDDVLKTIRKQIGIEDVKVQYGKLRVFGNSSDINNIKSYLEQALHERNETIAGNLKIYLQKSAKGYLLRKFKNKYRVGISYFQASAVASSAIEKLVTSRNKKEKQNDDDDDDDVHESAEEKESDDDDSDDDEDDSGDERDGGKNDISNVSSNATTNRGNVGRRPNRAQQPIQITLCSHSEDLLSKAIKELKSYALYSRRWALTQDEIAYILKQPQQDKQREKDNRSKKGRQQQKDKQKQNNAKVNEPCFIIKSYLIGLILSVRNSVVQIFVNRANGGMHVTVRGFKDHVENAVSKIKTSLADNVQTEVQFPISKVMAIFLRTKASSDIQKLKKTHRIELIVTSSAKEKCEDDKEKCEDDKENDDNDCLKLIGSSSRINSAKASVENFLERLFEKEQQFPCHTWDSSRNISPIIRAHLKKMRGSDDCEAIGWIKYYTATERGDMQPNIAVLIVGFNEEAVEDVVEECQNIVRGYVIWKPSEEEYRAIHRALIVTKSPFIQEFRQQWDTNIQLDSDTKTITIPARSKMIADDIKEALLNLGEEKKPQMKRISEFISIEPNIRRFVNQAIGPLLNEAKSQKIFVESKSRTGLKLQGRSDIVTKFKEKINSIIDDIKLKIITHRFQLSSVESDLLRSDTYKIVNSIERETNTLIRDVNVRMNSSVSNPNDDDTGLTAICVVNSRGQTIIVRKGDITKAKDVDAIVNAANGQLYHAGGVDKAIADAAGPALDQECKQLIANNDGLPIAAGKAVKTTAGNLPFKCVIHAIGPQFNDGNHQERPLLFFSVLSSLRLAEEQGYRSVALPAISSHTYRFPLADCTNIVVRAVKQFFADYPQSKMRKVILLDMNDAACNSFAREVVIDHRTALEEDDDIIKCGDLQPLTAKWCWQDDDGEKINDENHTRQIETSFQNYLKTSTTPSLVMSADNLKSGTIVNYSIHFLPNLQQILTSNPNALNGRLVCGHQKRQDTGYQRAIIRYPVIERTQSTSIAYSPKPLDLYSLQIVTTNDVWEIIGITSASITQSQAAIRKAIDSATISEQYSVNLNKDIDVHKEQIKSIATEQHIQINFGQECAGQLPMTLKGLKANVQEAKLKITLYANDILKKHADDDNELDPPKEWGDQKENLKLVEILRNDPEFVRIEKCTKETLSNVKIDKIERVQNLRLWSHYAFRRREIKNDLSLKPNLQIEMELFHGTRTTPPNEVYNGDCGFDMRFSTSGMWGIGSYFAQNASYSCTGYAHQLSNGKRQVFLAHVLTGDVHDCPSNQSLRMPPKKTDSSGLRYNSVSGVTGGSKVYIVYENRVAYPTYLITFTL
jgi:O-acetyl-ADP-ribose deacetylase (regulator of RNase III)